MTFSVHELIQIMQASIAPVTLISGVGLLLLSMTNRYGRAIDRTRILVKEVSACSKEEDKKPLTREIDILYRRALLIRMAIIFSVMSVFSVSLTIICLFISQLFSWNLEFISIALFSGGLLCLIVSLLFLIKDISLSLKALVVEIGKPLNATAHG